MSYLSVAAIKQNSWLRVRIAACVAVEDVSELPEEWVQDRLWALAAQPGWAQAWDSALAAHPEDSYEPGKDEAVITDGMILAAVQALV